MKIKNIFLTISLLTLLVNCSDLNTELKGQYTSDTFFKTKDQAISAINATYQIASFNSTNNNLWVFGDVASDDTVKGGNAGDASDIGYVDSFLVNPDNGAIEAFWKHYYEGIARANNIIYYVPLINMDPVLRDRIVGEAKFLRAYYYYHLTNIFGSVPLRITPVLNVNDLSVPLSAVEVVVAQIVKDLNEASNTLPPTYGPAEKGRATKGAALGLLSKVFLFQNKYTEALNAANQVESMGYVLTPLYAHNFDLIHKNNSESIFEIQHLSNQIIFQGTYVNQYFSPAYLNGYFFNAPTANFVNEFEKTASLVSDPRLDYSVGRLGNKWVDGKDFDPDWSPASGYLDKKQANDVIGTTPIGDGEKNYVFMRFSEILLIKAEALNELGRGSEALIPLNKVRERARKSYLFDPSLPGFGSVPALLLPDVTSVDQSTLRNAIRHERRVELGLEFHRFYDIMRYGKVYAENALSGTAFSYEKNRYFPLPQSERDTNTKL
ncbi:RagB/SusD family nutrient uptake outer membrane protein [Flavobacterium cellulosilyticum]|uniref:RagB/SusD family nutrient uptake outer membrane protein n=1 Tax=Flavobacterium cellulosilyticum TaxID=2541731 RepID=A0A4R5C7L3_9FLAO|nr:RagB/SusD family nutrient uptake outer membrane protein [Flavobacterium cellulosilyticum]TDD94719.1 RagB/SusD family nutrient uptake outer membrane protein [Flavobacterium cellulosilyticum]